MHHLSESATSSNLKTLKELHCIASAVALMHIINRQKECSHWPSTQCPRQGHGHIVSLGSQSHISETGEVLPKRCLRLWRHVLSG